MLETETVGPCLVQKFKWRVHSRPGPRSGYAPGYGQILLIVDSLQLKSYFKIFKGLIIKMLVMTSHVYNTSNNPLSTIKEYVSSDVNFEASESSVISETANLILNLEKKLISKFDGLDKEILNLKDVIIKNLQVENQRLRKKVSSLKSKVILLESGHNSLEQYGRRNNIEISGILDGVLDQNLEQKILEILGEVYVSVSPNDLEACHRIGSSVITQEEE